MDKILLVEKIINILHESHENAVAAAMRLSFADAAGLVKD